MSSPNNAYKTYRNLTTTGATSEVTGILSCAVGMHRGGGVQLTGTFSATLQFEETLDGGTTWIAKTVYPAGGGPGVTSTTSAGQWKFANGGSANFRVRCSSYTSGTAAVAITLTEGVDPIAQAAGTVAVSTATVSSLASAATSATLLSANTSRKGLIVQNTDANDLYLKYGTTASATDFTVKIPGNGGYWEMPQPVYSGRIDAIWAADGSGSAYYTEL